jgi:hypothetical protein
MNHQSLSPKRAITSTTTTTIIAILAAAVVLAVGFTVQPSYAQLADKGATGFALEQLAILPTEPDPVSAIDFGLEQLTELSSEPDPVSAVGSALG